MCCFVFFTPRVGVVSSSVGLHSRDKLEACFEKTGGYRKYIMGSASRYLRSLLDADGRFPRRQEAETTTFTDATGASRTALVSHEEVQAWADECHDCQLVEFWNLMKTSPVSAATFVTWSFEPSKKWLETLEALKVPCRSKQRFEQIPLAQSSQQLKQKLQKQSDWQVTLSW